MIHYYVVRVRDRGPVDAIKRLISALVAASPNTGSTKFSSLVFKFIARD